MRGENARLGVEITMRSDPTARSATTREDIVSRSADQEWKARKNPILRFQSRGSSRQPSLLVDSIGMWHSARLKSSPLHSSPQSPPTERSSLVAGFFLPRGMCSAATVWRPPLRAIAGIATRVSRSSALGAFRAGFSFGMAERPRRTLRHRGDGGGRVLIEFVPGDQ
jgi:hypothetical protein